jgi:outer membrane translocation and assembly module TamA
MTKDKATVSPWGNGGQPTPSLTSEPAITLTDADALAAVAALPPGTTLTGPLADWLAHRRQRAEQDEAPLRQQRAALEAQRAALVDELKQLVAGRHDEQEACLVLLKTTAQVDIAVLTRYLVAAKFVSAAATAAYDVTHDEWFRHDPDHTSALDRLPQSVAAVALLRGPVALDALPYLALVERVRELNDRLLALSTADPRHR